MKGMNKMSDEKLIPEGTHKVKVRNWGLRETKSGKIQAYIGFSNGATMFQMVGVSDIGDEILARSLTLCGFVGADLPDLFEDDALDKHTDVEIFVKYKANNETGKPDMNVYVNDPAKAMKGALDKKDASVLIKTLGVILKKDLKVAKSSIGDIRKAAPIDPEADQNTEAPAQDETIPF